MFAPDFELYYQNVLNNTVHIFYTAIMPFKIYSNITYHSIKSLKAFVLFGTPKGWGPEVLDLPASGAAGMCYIPLCNHNNNHHKAKMT